MRLRKRIVVAFVFSCILLTIYKLCKKRETIKLKKHKSIKKISSTSCHYLNTGDALLAVDKNYTVTNHSIFFIDTSCTGTLNSRQACSVESAARAHPLWQINVFFCSPVTEYALTQRHGSLATLQQFENIKFGRIHIAEFARETPLARLLKKQRFKSSMYPLENISNCLRLLTLYKWGGIYLDTDVIVTRSLESLGSNWVGKEDARNVNTAVLALSRDRIGKELIEDLLEELQKHYKPNWWGYNGPKLITRVLAQKWCSKCGHNKKCKGQNISQWTGATCRGLQLYDPEYFYPLHYTKSKNYFKAKDLHNVENAYAHHFWNRLTYHLEIKKHSPYAKMAQKYCPTIHEKFRKEFGSY